MKLKPQSLVLFGVQLLCLVFLVVTGRLVAAVPWFWLELAGVGSVAWAVYTMTPRRLTPWPEPRSDAQLVTRGPYRWVRHPMYTGVLLIALAWVLDRPTFVRLLVWLVLLADLLAKLEYEETLLARRFPGYAAYQNRTKRLIPRVY